MRPPGALFLILSLSFMITIGCSDSPISSESGTLKVSLTDAPGDFSAVNITFSEISANINEEWVTVRGEPITVNLLEWNNGKSIVIGSAEVPAGQYSQIRLKIEAAEIVADGQTHQVDVPSGAQTGLKLISDFTVTEGSTYELVVDFDANRSVVTTGMPSNPTGYKLKPTLRVVSKALTGSISGTVVNSQYLPLAYAIVAGDTLTSTAVDTSGAFMLAFLPPDMYTVSVSDTMGLAFVQNAVECVTGTNNDLGAVNLQ